MNLGLLVAILGGLVIFMGVFYFNEDTSIFDYSFLGSEENSEEAPLGEEEHTTTMENKSKSATAITNLNPTPNSQLKTHQKTEPATTNTDILVIIYSNNGFVPMDAQVEAGKAVRFVNASDRPLWITSDNHPTISQQFYPEFNQGKSITKGQIYTFTFAKLGKWGYYNLNNQKHSATVTVVEQQ